jgi:hypothetical protein
LGKKSGHLYVTHRAIYFVTKHKSGNTSILFEEITEIEKQSTMFSNAIDIALDDEVRERERERERET